jgi:hypothetical protein
LARRHTSNCDRRSCAGIGGVARPVGSWKIYKFITFTHEAGLEMTKNEI